MTKCITGSLTYHAIETLVTYCCIFAVVQNFCKQNIVTLPKSVISVFNTSAKNWRTWPEKAVLNNELATFDNFGLTQANAN